MGTPLRDVVMKRVSNLSNQEMERHRRVTSLTRNYKAASNTLTFSFCVFSKRYVLQHAQAALKGAVCVHCDQFLLRTLRSHRALFEESSSVHVPQGSGPASAEAGPHLMSWGSQMDVAVGLESDPALSLPSPVASVVSIRRQEARIAVSSAPVDNVTLMASSSEEMDVASVATRETEDSPLPSPELCEKAYWGKRIFAQTRGPAVCQGIRAERAAASNAEQRAFDAIDRLADSPSIIEDSDDELPALVTLPGFIDLTTTDFEDEATTSESSRVRRRDSTGNFCQTLPSQEQIISTSDPTDLTSEAREQSGSRSAPPPNKRPHNGESTPLPGPSSPTYPNKRRHEDRSRPLLRPISVVPPKKRCHNSGSSRIPRVVINSDQRIGTSDDVSTWTDSQVNAWDSLSWTNDQDDTWTVRGRQTPFSFHGVSEGEEGDDEREEGDEEGEEGGEGEEEGDEEEEEERGDTPRNHDRADKIDAVATAFNNFVSSSTKNVTELRRNVSGRQRHVTERHGR
ncbi:uncharacterized protein [Chanodichthys erythropterus]|uniref:uncharacterized protein n=1 Tax=Chanodichthys erythropterus TaxID=933992 RepID=UPI00351E6462